MNRQVNFVIAEKYNEEVWKSFVLRRLRMVEWPHEMPLNNE